MSVGTNRNSGGGAGVLLSFCITILISSFLIFQVQPLISKYILPWFGGTPGVWTTCMLFFQLVLFAGYAYAHFLIAKTPVRAQFLIHMGLLIGGLCLLPISPNPAWAPQGNQNPTLNILGLLAGSVGLPYFLLSSTGPLLQAWFSRRTGHGNPYWLYALSNIGSLAGLVTYPFLFEPLLPVDTQVRWWSYSFGAFAVFCAGCAVLASQRKGNEGPESEDVTTAMESAPPPPPIPPAVVPVVFPTAGPSGFDRFLWFILAASASTLLLATTNQVCLDIAVIPFLWVLPLTLYLLSFILCFGPRWCYPRPLFLLLFILSLAGMIRMMYIGTNASLLAQVLIYFAGLFVCCMVCHGEMVQLRPPAAYLTSFYLWTSAGGAAGGLLVGLIAPHVFNRYIELHIGIGACCLSVLLAYYRGEVSPFGGELIRPKPVPGEGQTTTVVDHIQRWAYVVLVAAGCGLIVLLWEDATSKVDGEIARSRSFYGVLRVNVEDEKYPSLKNFTLVNGRILHGLQFDAKEKRRIPTTYYGPTTGIGLLMQHYPKQRNRSVGLVGLGAGTMAAYGNAGDKLRFYEINPDVERIAKQYFTYLSDCPAKPDVFLGDARVTLQRELAAGQKHNFDVLVLDAFSSDAIPVHLLTKEAIEIYLQHLAPKGVIAVHISNRHFDLAPVVLALTDHFKLKVLTVDADKGPDEQYSSTWMLVGRDDSSWEDVAKEPSASIPDAKDARTQLWTDNFSNVVGILKSSPLDKDTWKEMWNRLRGRSASED